jgi:hypothetical protein
MIIDDRYDPSMGFYNLTWKSAIEKVAPKHGVSFQEENNWGEQMIHLTANVRGDKSAFWRELGAELGTQGIKRAV